MASFNRVFLLGNVGQAPEIMYTLSGRAVATLTVATDEKTKNEAGEYVKHTEWHRLVLCGKQAEVAAEYIVKGSHIHAEGRLQTRKYTDKNGVERSTTEVIAERFQLLDKRSDREPAKGGRLI